MLPRLTWHNGIKSAIAAPAATPESSKSPVIGLPMASRPTMLTQVIKVIAVSSMPARIAQRRASQEKIRVKLSMSVLRGVESLPGGL